MFDTVDELSEMIERCDGHPCILATVGVAKKRFWPVESNAKLISVVTVVKDAQVKSINCSLPS